MQISDPSSYEKLGILVKESSKSVNWFLSYVIFVIPDFYTVFVHSIIELIGVQTRVWKIELSKSVALSNTQRDAYHEFEKKISLWRPKRGYD